MWIQQRVQLSWTQTGTLGRRQTASLSWPFTPTQTAVAAGVEVWEMVTPTARGAQGVRRTRTPTDSLSRRLMVLPSPRRMTSNLYSAYSRLMSPVLCVLVSPKGLYIEYVHMVYCVYIYIHVCVESLWACHTDLNASAYILVDWNETRPWEQRFFGAVFWYTDFIAQCGEHYLFEIILHTNIISEDDPVQMLSVKWCSMLPLSACHVLAALMYSNGV